MARKPIKMADLDGRITVVSVWGVGPMMKTKVALDFERHVPRGSKSVQTARSNMLNKLNTSLEFLIDTLAMEWSFSGENRYNI